ncbi:TIGR03619 family F420-dependent LLM class oxidoreductase [Paractinoplanes rishiriensis]|uniref:F420-dependent oxidoreductase n=1 Tax=Paractinoplanes rishiriensis TaxID=1050105 RepID=A0A919JTE6_9ACTN|nr:TIGR03619 family F420-dependent LLM class oxidoreductase [Actinoplanes rishiriensis]GIE93042.1 F420-dependent oxidoreductase [Actinoplanes rishiriensis]
MKPRLLFLLSENWTLVTGRDLPELVRWARIVEDAGVDGVMLSEHVVLGPDASAHGVMGNPRDYAMPGNQDPEMPWPSSIVLLSAMAAATTRLRLVAGAIIAPLRHPLLLARELGTLDLVSQGRLVVQPTVSWSRDEYDALGVPFADRGQILDEQLDILQRAWQPGPFSYHGKFFSFDSVSLAPRAHRATGPRLWFGGQRLHSALLRRLVRYGHGFHPLGQPAPAELAALTTAMAEAGRDAGELELVGGTRAVFPDDHSVADLGAAMDPIREQIAAGFSTFCVKPSQFIDDPADLPRFCADVVRRLDEMAG